MQPEINPKGQVYKVPNKSSIVSLSRLIQNGPDLRTTSGFKTISVWCGTPAMTQDDVGHIRHMFVMVKVCFNKLQHGKHAYARQQSATARIS